MMMKKLRLLLTVLLFFPAFFYSQAQVASSPYASDILRFKKLDSINPPPQHAILFIGSSSFTKWKDVQDYFPGFPIINRAYGGSCLTDLIRDIKDLVYPYNPRQIVIYCGENDLAYNDTLSPPVVTRRFMDLFSLIRMKYPEVKITYVSMKPSPSRWKLAYKYTEANRAIRDFLKHHPHTSYVNVWNKMLGKDHKPIPGLFVDDKLHMNATGYRIWQKVIEPHLIK